MASNVQDTGSRAPFEGCFDSVKCWRRTLLAMAHTRLEASDQPRRGARAWLGSILVWTLVALLCAGVGVVLHTVRCLALWTPIAVALGIPAILFLLWGGAGLADSGGQSQG